MRVGTIGARVLLVVVAGSAVVGCDRNNDDAGSREADVLVGAIRSVVSSQSAIDVADVLPVVYVVGTAEHGVAAGVQADVVAELRDEIDVRFADERDEAVKSDEVDEPVPDSGVLLVVDEIPEEGDPVDVSIEIYRSERDDSMVVFTFAERTSGWIVTATSLVSSGA